MNQYLLLLHEAPAHSAHVSPAEMQEMIARYQAWAQSLGARQRLAGGEKLTDDGGRRLRLQDGRPLASDGPYAEAHDVIGGYYLIRAEAMAAECPHLGGSRWIELRRIDTLM